MPISKTIVLVGSVLLLLGGLATVASPEAEKKRVTVEDTIRMTTLPETLYAGSDASDRKSVV